MARIALVSPYAWTAPGGVNAHVASLAAELRRRGDDVLVLAPGGGDVSLGATVGVRSNGAISRLALGPSSIVRARAAIDAFDPDVVHLHEPVAPLPCWDLLGCRRPLVGTFHCHSERALPHALANLAGARRRLNRLHVRLAVSGAAAWTGRRFYGGRYRIVPNGIDLPGGTRTAVHPLPGGSERTVHPLPGGSERTVHPLPGGSGRTAHPLPARGPVVAFVGQDVPRKGLAVLREAMRDVPAELVCSGPGDAARDALLRRATVLAAPSLRGESFGIVLLEAMAHGTPVVAGDIPGYREVAAHGAVLVPPGDPAALAAALRALLADEERRSALGAQARLHAARFAWPLVAEQVVEAYADARALAAAPRPLARRAAVAAGLRCADPEGDARPVRRAGAPLPGGTAAPAARGRRPPLGGPQLRAAVAGCGLAALAGAGVLLAPAGARPAWVLGALGLMALSLAVRGVAWHLLLRGARVPVSAADAVCATAAGVLLSASLPARLGEPARAALVAARAGRVGDHLPAVGGTLVAQTALNVLALVALAAVAAGAMPVLPGPLLLLAVIPAALAAAVLAAPARRTLRRARAGLLALGSPRHGPPAAALQLAAWALQWLACWVLLAALGIDAGPAAAAGVLLAVNVTAVLPATPSNVGVFQAACVAALAGAHDVPVAEALAYGVVLQAVEVAVALLAGVPALLREGLTLREARARALRRGEARAPEPT